MAPNPHRPLTLLRNRCTVSRRFEYAIATARLVGLPAAISVLTFALNAAFDFPGLSGIA